MPKLARPAAVFNESQHPRTSDSIVEAAGKNTYLVRQDLINRPVCLIDAPRPAPGQFVLEWLWFAQPRKRLPLDFTNEANNPKSLGAVLPNPPSQSSNAEESNSKLLNDSLERHPFHALGGR